jgi:serine/threonine protein kinase
MDSTDGIGMRLDSELSAALPGYQIGRVLGRGAFGVVYAGRHVALGRDVAIKHLWPDLLSDADARRRFSAEARLLASLDHPQIVRVYDYVEGDVYALVMERMRGGTLADRLGANRPSAHLACTMAAWALHGLEHAHQHGVLHRDVKPQNLLFAQDGQLKVADFGIAKVAGSQDLQATITNRRLGTPAYMAPEQVSRALGPVSAATDVWAVGAILYELLAGQHPFTELGDFGDVLLQRITEDPRPVRELTPKISTALSEAIAKALRRTPAERFQTAAEFANAIEATSEAAVGAGPQLQDGPRNHVVAPTAKSAPTRVEPLSARVTVPLPSRLQPFGPSVFVNRQRERAVLARALEQGPSSDRQAVFVTGEPGIGKTRLVSEVACEAHVAGTLVLAGRCDEGLNVPYQPFVEALEHLIANAPTELLETHVAHYGHSLARLVPSLAPRVSDSPIALPPASESERYVLFRAIDGLLAAAGAGGSVLLVLEDLHWAELPTLKLLRGLLASPRSAPLMLLCTCRVKELAEEHPLRELLADLHREPRSLRIGLGGLKTDDVVELMRGISDDPLETADDQLVSALEASTDGNPFFITELVRSLFETGAVASEDGHWRLSAGVDPAAQLPLSISETLASRLRRMRDDVRTCLQAAAVLGDEFDLDLVTELMDGNSAVEALDAAVADAVLIEVPGQPGRFRFAHALMQRYLYGNLGSVRRTELHRRVALALEARLEEGRWPIAELARHWIAAGNTEPGKALRYASLAGDEALAKLAPGEARRWYQLSLELLGRRRAPQDSELCDLLVRRGEAERQAGDRNFRETLLEAAELAREIGDTRGLVRAALANSRGMQSETGIVDEARVAMLDAALRVVGDGDSAERARLLAMQAAELMYSAEWDRRVRLADEALAIARRLDDPDALSMVLNMRFVTLLVPETHAERRANTVEAVGAAERLSDPLARFFAYHWRGYALVEAGDIAAARSWLAREREIADRFHQPTAVWLAQADEANLAIIAGKLDAADRLAAAALEIGRHSEPDALACYAAQQTSIAFERGRLGDQVTMLERAVEDNPGVPGFRAALALALSEGSRFREAEKMLDRDSSLNFTDLSYDVTWLAAACIYAHVSSTLGHVASARMLYELLEPWSEQIAFPAFGVWGPVGLYLGSLALVIGDLDSAGRHLSKAARAATRAGAPMWEARATSQLTRLAEIAG